MKNLFAVKIAKTNDVLDFDTTKLPVQSVEYVMQYGFNKAINDAHVSIQRKDYADGAEGDAAYAKDVREAYGKRVAQIESGNVPGSRGVADPLAAKGRKLAKMVDEAGLSDDPETEAAIAKLLAARAKKLAAA